MGWGGITFLKGYQLLGHKPHVQLASCNPVQALLSKSYALSSGGAFMAYGSTQLRMEPDQVARRPVAPHEARPMQRPLMSHTRASLGPGHWDGGHCNSLETLWSFTCWHGAFPPLCVHERLPSPGD